LDYCDPINSGTAHKNEMATIDDDRPGWGSRH
jgi:hypothetical protein